MPQIEIKHLELIQTVAETENLTRAAQRLHISQPALSRRLGDIEDRLGTHLFHRSKKRMMLTPEGSRMLESAHTILSELALAELDISKLVNGETGTLRIGVSCIFCFKWLPQVVTAFHQHYPKVDLSLSTSQDFAVDLKNKTFDMVVTATSISDETIGWVALFQDEMVAVMAPDHPLSAGHCLTATDVGQLKLIVSDNFPIEAMLQMVWPDTAVMPASVMRIGHPNAIIDLVGAGLGISVAPRWAVHDYLSDGSLAAIPISDRGVHPTWKVAYLKTVPLPAYRQTFIDLMAKQQHPH